MSRGRIDDPTPPKRLARLRVGEIVEASFFGCDAFGAGIGHPLDTQLPHIHCPDVFAGERARVRVLAIAKRAKPVRAHCKLIELIETRPERVEPSCAAHEQAQGRCGGCPLMQLEPATQMQTKRERIEAVLGLPVDQAQVSQDNWGYRWSAKRVAGGRRGELVLGSFVRGTHRVADMAGCKVDHPLIMGAFEELVDRANELEITAWRSPADGELRYVWAKTNGREVLLTLLGAEPAQARLATLARSLTNCAGVYLGVREQVDNAVRGDDKLEPITHLCGLDALPYEDAGVSERLGPLGFLQPNPKVASEAYDALIADNEGQPLAGELAFDLYAGAGLTTTRLRRNFEQVRPVESYVESARSLGVEAQSAAEFLAGYRGPTPDLVVANPPRAGLGNLVCAHLVELSPPRLQIMSCSPDSFARDLARLRPHFELRRLALFDTLPHTAHVELVAWLTPAPTI